MRLRQVAAAKASILKSTEKKPIAQDLGPKPSVPSGSSCIDDLIGGSMAMDGSGPKCLGYPRRQITELYGLESSGKTTAALQAVAAVQKQGGLAMYLDFEHGLDDAYAMQIGVSFDEDKLLRYKPDTLEDGWQMIYVGIRAGCDIIVIDSVPAMTPAAELNNKKPGEAPKIGAVAASMAAHLPKVLTWLHEEKSPNPKGTAIVFINQIRAVIQTGGGHGTNENTAGGYALKFFAYVRIKFTKIRSDFVKVKNKMTGRESPTPFGNHTRVKLVKCKVDGKQGFTTDIFIRYNYGIDDYFSMIEAATNMRLIHKSSATYTIGDQKIVGRDKLRKYLIANPEVFSALRVKVLESVRAEMVISDDDEVDDLEDILISDADLAKTFGEDKQAPDGGDDLSEDVAEDQNADADADS